MVALIVILGIASLITWVWLIVTAFKENAWWGIGMILIPFPLALVFAALHWQDAKKPFLAYFVANILFTVVWFKMFYEIFSETMDVASQQQSGEISEEEAQRRMFEMLGMEIPPELRKSDSEPESTQDEIAKLTEQLEQNNQAEPAAEPEPQRVEVYNPIKLSQAKKHIGKVVQITTINGVVKQGKLTDVRYDRIVVERQYRGGNFTFEVLNRTVDRLAVQEFEEY